MPGGARFVPRDSSTIAEIQAVGHQGGELLTNLLAAGAQPSDVTTVFVSHLHTDHFGWLERDGEPVFANALVRIGAADWQHFVADPPLRSRRAERLRVIEDHTS